MHLFELPLVIFRTIMEKTVFSLSMVELIELQLVNSKDFLTVISQY